MNLFNLESLSSAIQCAPDSNFFRDFFITFVCLYMFTFHFYIMPVSPFFVPKHVIFLQLIHIGGKATFLEKKIHFVMIIFFLVLRINWHVIHKNICGVHCVQSYLNFSWTLISSRVLILLTVNQVKRPLVVVLCDVHVINRH